MLTFKRWTILLFALVTLAIPFSASARFDDAASYRRAQEYMVELINKERTKKGAQEVRLDAPAGQLAKQHAEDMLQRRYFSHWNPEGIKPTRRWNLIGGYDNVAENIYFSQGRRADAESLVKEAMRTFMDSSGHRRTIMDPAHTHVGIGFAWDERGSRFYVDQSFVTRAGGEYSCPTSARPGETVTLAGRFDPACYSFGHVIVGYEDLPRPRDTKWLDKQNSYSDANQYVAGYSDNPRIRFGDMPTHSGVKVDDEGGSFACRAALDHKGREGLYYLSVWLRDRQTGREVLAAVATVEARK